MFTRRQWMQYYRTKGRPCHKYQLSVYQSHEPTTSLACSYHQGLGCCVRGVSCEPDDCLLSKHREVVETEVISQKARDNKAMKNKAARMLN